MAEKIHIESFWRSLNKYKEELCGDRVMIRRNEDCIVVVLADGLGSGVKANILSTLTSTIISEMIYSGLPLKDAVETILATLPMDADRGIAYSTFTIVQVFYDGRCYISQSENPDLVMLRKGKVYHPKEENVSFSGRTVKLSQLRLQPDDYIVVCSDGVEHAGMGDANFFGWGVDGLEKFLEANYKPNMEARFVTSMVLDEVQELYRGRARDDSTTACIRILPVTENRIMIGPPRSYDDDEMVVNKLLSCNGKKICCGGSTSTMVARVTGRELRPDSLLNMVPGVPPMGFIDGIDLVTEGVITLQAVDLHLRKAVADGDYFESLLDSTETDGVSQLTRMLLSLAEVTFMMGLSNNPSHDAINWSPISLSAKVSVIHEIADNLAKLGKIVRIEEY